MTMRPLARSSMTRYSPLRSTTAATVTSGFQIMSGIIRGPNSRSGSEVDRCRAQLRLDQAARPDFVVVRQVALDDARVVELDDAIPARALLPIHDGLVVGDDERAGVPTVFRRDVAQ